MRDLVIHMNNNLEFKIGKHILRDLGVSMFPYLNFSHIKRSSATPNLWIDAQSMCFNSSTDGAEYQKHISFDIYSILIRSLFDN